jgi:flagellar biosynthesis anti-sigma factor FlgM
MAGMQINDGNLLGIQQPAAGQANRTDPSGGGKAAQSGPRSTPGDAVQLSSFAHKINELQDDSVSRQGRVEELRNLYMAGKYEVDSPALAQTMIDSHIRS